MESHPPHTSQQHANYTEENEDRGPLEQVLRVIQLILVALIVGYIIWSFIVARYPIKFPLLPMMPAAVMVFGGFALGWLIGWLPSRIHRWRMRRSVMMMRSRVQELERSLGIRGDAVIPDRTPRAASKPRNSTREPLASDPAPPADAAAPETSTERQTR